MTKAIDEIKARNARVEADKAWETSETRRSLIAIGTYVIVVVFLFQIKNDNPFVNALIPVIGYVLSTLSLPFAKKWWLENACRKK